MEAETETAECAAQTTTNVPRNRLAILLVALLVIAPVAVWAYNEVTVQKPLSRILISDPRNHVVKASAHYDGWLDFNTIVFDVTDLSGDATRMDVFRLFLQYAQAMKESRVKRVILAADGKNKFVLDGDYFNELGREFDSQNPIYTMRTFPLHVTAMDGSHPFSEYTGGLLGVLTKEMDQFGELQDKWYVEELSGRGK
jgi:hypothetical protein